MNKPTPIPDQISESLEQLNGFLDENGRKRPTVRIMLEVPLSYLDFDKCHCEPDSISGECEGVPFSDPCWDIDLSGLEYIGEEVEVCEEDRERVEDYLIEIKRGHA